MKQFSPARRLCIVTAVDIEFKTASGLLAERRLSNESEINICHGRFGDRRITLLKSEIGAIGFADRLEKHLVNARYDAMVVAGFAGALDPQLKIGDAIVFDFCRDARSHNTDLNSRKTSFAREENASISCDSKLTQFVFENLSGSGLSCFRGAGVTVDRIITKAAEKASLRTRYGALAVDMETCDLVSACKASGLPATAVRVISDEADSDLPDFNRALNPDGRMNHWLTASVMVASPVKSARFLLSLRPAVRALRANMKAIFSV